MTPEDWRDQPWAKIILEDSISERLDPLDAYSLLLEELFRELSACEEIVCGSSWESEKTLSSS